MKSYLDYIPTVPLNKPKMKSWIGAGKNVMLVGSHGIGKTQRILEVFREECGDDFAFFNGATTDPWTQLLGIPHVREGSDGELYLRFVKPEELGDELRAIFIDELNRAKAATRNALMELIQFRAINGKVYPNLQVVWASINHVPGEEEDDKFFYTTEKLDDALIDRFPVIVRVDPAPDLTYFAGKHGERGRNAVMWWREQPAKAQTLVTPRRLDYVLTGYERGVPLLDLLPSCSNVAKLEETIDKDPKMLKFIASIDSKTKASSKFVQSYLRDPENYKFLLEYIPKTDKWDLLLDCPEELIAMFHDRHRESLLAYVYSSYRAEEDKGRIPLYEFIDLKEKGNDEYEEWVNRKVQAVNFKLPKKTFGNREHAKRDLYEKLTDQFITDGRKKLFNTYHRRKLFYGILYNIPDPFFTTDFDRLKQVLNIISERKQNLAGLTSSWGNDEDYYFSTVVIKALKADPICHLEPFASWVANTLNIPADSASIISTLTSKLERIPRAPRPFLCLIMSEYVDSN